ncbi:MAG TPA: substrate-binding domain-containing protein [Gemmatimonadaceae bacterium]
MRFAPAVRWTIISGLSLLAATAVGVRASDADAAVNSLRVCADPNNLPFSNSAREGFENKIADLVARDLGKTVEYTWWAQRRGFVRNTLNARACDVIIGVPGSFDLTAVTNPYYRSSYVFVTRRDRNLNIKSYDDPRLKRLRIGVQLVGDDGANTPPVHALGNRGIRGNLKGYSLYGDYSKPHPPSKIIDAVANGEVDVAIVWGPLAGYFAKLEKVALDLTPVSPKIDLPFMPQVFDIAMGVRREDKALRDSLDVILEKEKTPIAAILDTYNIPRT